MVKPRKGNGTDGDVVDALLAGADLEKHKTTFVKVPLKHKHNTKKGAPTKLQIDSPLTPRTTARIITTPSPAGGRFSLARGFRSSSASVARTSRGVQRLRRRL